MHVGLIQYSETVKTTIEIALNQYVNVEDLAAAVAKVLYHEGSEADLAHALRIADLIVSFCLYLCMHSVPSDSNNKRRIGHVGVPNKRR